MEVPRVYFELPFLHILEQRSNSLERLEWREAHYSYISYFMREVMAKVIATRPHILLFM